VSQSVAVVVVCSSDAVILVIIIIITIIVGGITVLSSVNGVIFICRICRICVFRSQVCCQVSSLRLLRFLFTSFVFPREKRQRVREQTFTLSNVQRTEIFTTVLQLTARAAHLHSMCVCVCVCVLVCSCVWGL